MPASPVSNVAAAGLAAAELSHWDPEDYRTVAYASAIGDEFEFDLLSDALGMDAERLAERIERFVELGILRERPGGGRFAFAEDDLRVQVYQSLTESRLRIIHRKIAQSIELTHPNPGPEIVEELGRHYFLGKVAQKAWGYNLEAARAARGRRAPEAAIPFLERARSDLLTLPARHSEELLEVEETLGDLWRSLGRTDAADEAYRSAIDRLPIEDRRTHARLLLSRAELARDLLKAESAKELAAQSLAYFLSVDDPRGQASAHRLLSRISREEDDGVTALDEAMAALELLKRTVDRRALGECCTDLALALSSLGEAGMPEAATWYRRAVEVLRETGDGVGLARALAEYGHSLGAEDPPQSLELLSSARSTARAAVSPRWEARAMMFGTEPRLALGELEEAERVLDGAQAIIDRVPDPEGSQYAVGCRGMIAERRGLWDEAEGAYIAAARAAGLLGLLTARAEWEFRLARMRFKTRDLEGARAAFRSASAVRLETVRPRLSSALAELARQLGESSPDG